MKPKVFVCDEPTANLDAAGTRQLAQTLRQLKEQGFTLLLAEHRIDWLMGIDVYKRQRTGSTIVTVTHDRRCASALCDRAAWLKDGRIKTTGGPELIEAAWGDSAAL